MTYLARWDQSLSQEQTDDLLLQIASQIATSLPPGHERDRISHLCNSGDIRSLCAVEVDYERETLSSARGKRQIRALFEKRRDLDLGVNKRSVAMDTFMASEDLCRQSNEVFRKISQGSFSFEPCVSIVLHYAQRKITEILGDLPKLADLRLRFGPGATTGTKKKNATPRVKLGTSFACSRDLAPYVDAILGECPGWIPFKDDDTVTVDVEIHSSRLSTVPKSWKTDRVICTEPVLNGFIQNSIGDYLAGRLKGFGIDIRDQTRNQTLARLGSLSGELATLDLSSASDCISQGLVWDLLPFDWASSLSVMRSSSTIIPSGYIGNKEPVEIQLQKFSTMGNGFTFPLETLIFYSLGWGVLKSLNIRTTDLSVYGDDIIIPTQGYDLMVKVLRAVGFLPNRGKSFSSGPFRESCGGDYFSGIDIRPIYVKDSLSGESLFTLHNGFRRRYEDELADIVLDQIPDHLRLFGPDGYGDGCLLPAFGKDPELTPFGRERGWSGYTFDIFVRKPLRLTRHNMPGDRVLPVYSIYSENLDRDPDEPLCMLDVQPKAVHYTYRDGALSVPLPGSKGYRRISIYTLKG